MTEEQAIELKQEAKSMHLVYSSSDKPGFTRKRRGKAFIYFDAKGKRIKNEQLLKRFKALVIPPAWTDVWICASENGHLQVTGTDAAGRKQYKYHPEWNTVRNERKHNKMAAFAQVLPVIREKVNRDLAQEKFNRNKVLALAVTVMDKTFIRIGNSAYSKLYGSYGLTSLRNRHLSIYGSKAVLSFKGKKGVQQRIKFSHARLSKMLRKLKDIPGQDLFQFYDEDGTRKVIESGDVNEYIKECCGESFTAKDFRTWWGTVTAAVALASMPVPLTQAQTKENIIAAVDIVANKLGNTRAVCKKYYIHPMLIEKYESGGLGKLLNQLNRAAKRRDSGYLRREEEVVAKFIKAQA